MPVPWMVGVIRHLLFPQKKKPKVFLQTPAMSSRVCLVQGLCASKGAKKPVALYEACSTWLNMFYFPKCSKSTRKIPSDDLAICMETILPYLNQATFVTYTHFYPWYMDTIFCIWWLFVSMLSDAETPHKPQVYQRFYLPRGWWIMWKRTRS